MVVDLPGGSIEDRRGRMTLCRVFPEPFLPLDAIGAGEYRKRGRQECSAHTPCRNRFTQPAAYRP